MSTTPRICIHGGAGNITASSLPPTSAAYKAYTDSLRSVLETIRPLVLPPHNLTALEVATTAVKLLEDNPLFNAGKGSVFNSVGENELEASVMVSRGSEKRGVGVQLLRRVKNPIILAKELLGRPKEVKHNCISGEEAEKWAEKWGCEIVDEKYFWTEKRWKEHLRGLEGEGERNLGSEASPVPLSMGHEELAEHLPQGTVGCIVLDKWGTLCVATSTGGMTNKIPGRIGDTPTIGAGFWAEEWEVEGDGDQGENSKSSTDAAKSPPFRQLSLYLSSAWSKAPPPAASTTEYAALEDEDEKIPTTRRRAVAMSGTGNGEYFLRLAAAHLVAARCRFGGLSLQEAMDKVVGEDGEMQRAAEDVGRWGTGEGEGGFIGIDEGGKICMSLNCGGMFRGYVDDEGAARVAVFRGDDLE